MKTLNDIFRLFKQAANLLEETSDFFTSPSNYRRDIEELEKIFRTRYPGEGLGQDFEDVEDDFTQSGFKGVAVEENGRVVGYFYGYQAVPDEEIPTDISPEDIVWHSGYGQDNFLELMQALEAGQIFYASNLVVKPEHRIKAIALIGKLIKKVGQNYDYICADTLQDSSRFLFNEAGQPNAANLRRAGLDLMCSYNTGYSKFVVLKIKK